MIGAIYECEELETLFMKETELLLRIRDYCVKHNVLVSTQYIIKKDTFRLEIKTLKNGKTGNNGEISSN